MDHGRHAGYKHRCRVSITQRRPKLQVSQAETSKLGPDRAKVINDEVEHLLKAMSIREVKYPDWLATTVVVKKKNGK